MKTRKEVTTLFDTQKGHVLLLGDGDTGKTDTRHVLGFNRLRGHFYANGSFSCCVRQSYGYGVSGGEFFVYDHIVSRFDAVHDAESGRYVVAFDLPVLGRYAQVYIENTAGSDITVSGFCYAI